ncbi:MAG TPA: hypothetical protein VH371_03145 [Candidatus Limnocylindrales bacterium]
MATATPSKRKALTTSNSAERLAHLSTSGETVQDPIDLALLQKYEPIVHYNQGELFFPTAVDSYLADCDMLMGRTQRDQVVVAQAGELSRENLGEHIAEPGKSLYLRLVQKPLNGFELARWQVRSDRPRFRAAGRLARVGLFGRLLDAGFNVSLLLRGTVPGGTAAAAQIKYAAAREKDPRYVYYGRVVRRRGWIVLQYLYFYFMNDYRSTFHGVNDHEADWEQVFVYLEDAPGGPKPVWIAAAAHDYIGDQLRRRWDDPTFVKSGDHPVVFAGAGSHATYFEQGEYMTSAPISGLRGVVGLLEAGRNFWVNSLRQPDPGDLAKKLESTFSASFVDYARGDGTSLGPGGDGAWSPILISDADGWVDGYRGLFGLDTHDRFGGERSPAGPKYARSGEQRLSWQDPLGFAGLDKADPPFQWPQTLLAREQELNSEADVLDSKIKDQTDTLPGLSLEVQALAEDGGMEALHRKREAALTAGELELRRLRAERAAIDDQVSATRRERIRVVAGDLGDPRAHLTHPHRPVPPDEIRHGLFIEIWSAVSAALLLVAVAVLVWFEVLPWWAAIPVALAGYLLIESAFRRRLTQLTLRLVLILAFIAVALLVINYSAEIVIVGIVGLAVFLLVDNLREVLGR